MKALDWKKELKHLYQPSTKEVGFVNVPPMNFLMVEGKGNPNTSPEYAEAIEALYAVAYTIKFAIKKSELAIDYRVMPLEGLWWAEDMNAFINQDKSAWMWTMMIAQPPFISDAIVQTAIAEVSKKKNPAAIGKVRFAEYAEGDCAQIMHIGPFEDEGPNIEKVHQCIESLGRSLRGKHHEIYLSDIRRAAPEKWKTVIRQPMQ